MIRKLLAVLVAGAFMFAVPACDKKAEEAKTEAVADDKGGDKKKEEKKEEAK